MRVQPRNMKDSVRPRYDSKVRQEPFKTLRKIRPTGSLQSRQQSNGAVVFYWRYTMGVTSERVPIGLYDSSAPPKSLTRTQRGYSLAAAARVAESLAIAHYDYLPSGGRPALLKLQQEQEQARADNELVKSRYTLANLLNDYADQLEALGRISHSEARSIFNLHVLAPWPDVALMPACEVTTDHIVDMMRRPTDAGKGRTSNKLRSYLRAAFQMAKAARTRASVPEFFKSYQIAVNPVVDTDPDESANRADKHPLVVEELRAYWRGIRSLAGFEGAVLRLELLTGGQRIAQFVRLKTADIGADSIVIYDRKGRPGKAPRRHEIPLTPQAAQSLRECLPMGEYALSTDGGVTHIAGTTLSGWAVAHAGSVANFRAKRIRSGVETLLSKSSINQEIRGHLQSHGVSGVQRKHYDDNDFMPEKRRALEMLFRVLEGQT